MKENKGFHNRDLVQLRKTKFFPANLNNRNSETIKIWTNYKILSRFRPRIRFNKSYVSTQRVMIGICMKKYVLKCAEKKSAWKILSYQQNHHDRSKRTYLVPRLSDFVNDSWGNTWWESLQIQNILIIRYSTYTIHIISYICNKMKWSSP